LKIKNHLSCEIISVFNRNFDFAENQYPCFFIFNKQQRETELVILPLKNDLESMISYFKLVNEKYFNNHSF
jgi:hypothetical protein